MTLSSLQAGSPLHTTQNTTFIALHTGRRVLFVYVNTFVVEEQFLDQQSVAVRFFNRVENPQPEPLGLSPVK